MRYALSVDPNRMALGFALYALSLFLLYAKNGTGIDRDHLHRLQPRSVQGIE
jgi:hypothetical protein